MEEKHFNLTVWLLIPLFSVHFIEEEERSLS